MAVPSYETDLLPIDLAEAVTNWAEPTAAGWISGGSPAQNDDNPFQGNFSVSQDYNATGVGGMLANKGSTMTIPTDGAFTGWFSWTAPGSLESDSNGGIRFMCGTDLANFLSWDVGGLPSYAYGGWANYAVNTTITADDTVGTGLGNSQYSGAAVNNLNSIFKGDPLFVDGFRYGRCEARMYGGETANYATFAGYAAVNDTGTNRWGLIQAISSGYLVKGLVIFGYVSAVDFRDSNKSLFIQSCPKVTANFNTFEVRQVGSRIDWTGINITSLTTQYLPTASKGRFLTTDNADVNLDTCAFTDMNTFLFMSGATILNTTFRRCGIVTQGGAVFTNCKFDNPSGTKAMTVDTIANVTNCAFISDGTGYALEGFSSAGTYSFTNLTFTNYAVGNGTTGNEAIHVLAASGIVTIGISGGTATPSIHTEGATVNLEASVTLKMVVKDESGTVMSGVSVYIDDQDAEPYILNTTTDINGEASVGYVGSPITNARWRARKFGYKPFQQLVSVGTENITLPITMVVDEIVL